MLLTPRYARSASFDGSYVGAITLVAYPTQGQTGRLCGFAVCQGQTLSISEWTALFSLLSTTYGGDGVTHFRLPDIPVSDGLTCELNYNGFYHPRS